LQEPINQGGFSMVNMGNNGYVSYVSSGSLHNFHF
jgi:hypothetical protein